MKHKYYYFISFSHEHGFGNSRCKLDFKLNSQESITKIQKLLCEWNDVKGIVVLNFIELRR